MKVKIFSDLSRTRMSFSGKLTEPIFNALEQDMNNWFAANPQIKIFKIEQVVTGGTFLGDAEKLIVTIFYEESEGCGH